MRKQAVAEKTSNILSRDVVIHICRDGTISYRKKGEPIFNGIALAVFSVDTVEQAKTIQIMFGRKQWTKHPDNDMEWYKWHKLADGSDVADREVPLFEVSDLVGVTERLIEYWNAGCRIKPIGRT